MSKCNIFNSNDYDSGEGMLTSVWGPSLWHSIHTISFNYPVKPSKEEKNNYYNFVINLKNVLPCRYCRENFVNNLKQIKFSMNAMKNRDSFSKAMFDLHETVNCMLNKKSGLTYEEVRERYEIFRSRCLQKPKKTKKKSKKEKGCTNPLYGVKSKCVLNIVPKNKKCKSFNIDQTCIPKSN